jgi:hypothetical protein
MLLQPQIIGDMPINMIYVNLIIRNLIFRPAVSGIMNSITTRGHLESEETKFLAYRVTFPKYIFTIGNTTLEITNDYRHTPAIITNKTKTLIRSNGNGTPSVDITINFKNNFSHTINNVTNKPLAE